MLKIEWVERIFQEFSNLYGTKAATLWDGQDPDRLKAYWADKLDGFSDKPEAIRAALDALTEHPFPPTLPEFVVLCRTAAKRIGPKVPALTYTYDSDRAKRFSAELAKVVDSANRGADPRFWATHPKGHQAFEHILGAAENNPTVFQPCIDHLIAEGRVSDDGKHLLQKYAGMGQWVKA